MSIRAGESWQAGPGRRRWVSGPLWAAPWVWGRGWLLLLLPLWLALWGCLASLWLGAELWLLAWSLFAWLRYRNDPMYRVHWIKITCGLFLLMSTRERR